MVRGKEGSSLYLAWCERRKGRNIITSSLHDARGRRKKRRAISPPLCMVVSKFGIVFNHDGDGDDRILNGR
jgi:hypothetical protein